MSLRLRGECEIALFPAGIKDAVVRQAADSVYYSFDVPIRNSSDKQQAIVVFASAQAVPGDKESKIVDTWVRVSLTESPRLDGYFEAVLVKPGKSAFVHVEVVRPAATPPRGDGLVIDLFLAYYGRKPMAALNERFTVSWSAFMKPLEFESASVAPTPVRKSANPKVFPITTHLIVPGENLGKTILRYTEGMSNPGDWIAIAESVVAIAQGRVYPVTAIKPGFWAKRLNRFFHYDSSLNSCYSLEMAIREVGLWRVMLGVAAGLLGKIFGRSGDFYRVAGRGAATIDDCTGTLPPFDKSVVMGPKNPGRAAEEIKKLTGFEVAVVDANDLRKVDILGKSSGIIDKELIAAIVDNPQGNADEQSPFVLIKR